MLITILNIVASFSRYVYDNQPSNLENATLICYIRFIKATLRRSVTVFTWRPRNRPFDLPSLVLPSRLHRRHSRCADVRIVLHLRDESVACLAVKNPQVQTIDIDSDLIPHNRSVVFRFTARLTVACIPGHDVLNNIT